MNSVLRANEDPDNYFLRIERLARQLDDMGSEVSDIDLVGVVTRVLPESYSSTLPVIDSLTPPTYDGVKNILRHAYRRLADEQKNVPNSHYSQFPFYRAIGTHCPPPQVQGEEMPLLREDGTRHSRSAENELQMKRPAPATPMARAIIALRATPEKPT